MEEENQRDQIEAPTGEKHGGARWWHRRCMPCFFRCCRRQCFCMVLLLPTPSSFPRRCYKDGDAVWPSSPEMWSCPTLPKMSSSSSWSCPMLLVVLFLRFCASVLLLMHETIERYKRHTKNTRVGQPSIEEDIEHLKDEAANMMKKVELLEDSKRKLLGDGLCSCTMEELQKIEKQLERSVSSIRARKDQVYKEKIAKLKEKEKTLEAEHAVLSKKCGLTPIEGVSEPREIFSESSPSSEVETGLFIGPPETRLTLVPYNFQI